MTDEEVSEAAQNLKVLALIKSANNYNRYCQAQKTREANEKLEALLARREALLEKDLVHKEDHNATTSGLRDTISTMENSARESTQQSGETIRSLETRIDTLQKQLYSIEQYIRNNYGVRVWKNIKNNFISKANYQYENHRWIKLSGMAEEK
ncbi:MAG: hypothetical protein BRC51_14185 [Cyanobacteria bacterium SW_12_48_29]|nr:MAG: hypothetical protein BRC51_14185 [Cyanobacteria bacterium SW_12_48_29]